MIVFDVDGVLLDNKLGGFKDILVLLDKGSDVRRIDKEYQERKLAGPWGLEQLAALYKGESLLTLRDYGFHYCQEFLMLGAKDAVASLRDKGWVVGALSSNPQFLMDTLRGLLLLDFAFGTELEFVRGKCNGRIVRKVDRYEKAKLLEKKMKDFGLKKEQVVVVGDSITDLPMAKLVGKFIAFPKDEETRKAADVIIDKKDLREILKHL